MLVNVRADHLDLDQQRGGACRDGTPSQSARGDWVDAVGHNDTSITDVGLSDSLSDGVTGRPYVARKHPSIADRLFDGVDP